MSSPQLSDHDRKVVLELGGNAGAIVDETADLDWAVARLVYGAFAYAGQVCISVQRIYVVDSIYAEFERRFVEKVRGVKAGDPLDPATQVIAASVMAGLGIGALGLVVIPPCANA